MSQTISHFFTRAEIESEITVLDGLIIDCQERLSALEKQRELFRCALSQELFEKESV